MTGYTPNREHFLLSTKLGLRYETTEDQLRLCIVRLRELLHSHPKTIHTENTPIFVRFVEFSESSLKVNIRAYILADTHNEFIAIQE